MTTARMNQLRELVPELFQYPGTVLYIGANKTRMQGLPELVAAGHEVSVLEIWPENVDGLRGWKGIAHLIRGDVRDVDSLDLPHSSYDIVFWWHGPEHVTEAELPDVLARLEGLSTFLVILACPWGRYVQGAARGNPHEVHLSHLYPRHFEELGYETATLGREDVPGSNLLAWKNVSEMEKS